MGQSVVRQADRDCGEFANQRATTRLHNAFDPESTADLPLMYGPVPRDRGEGPGCEEGGAPCVISQHTSPSSSLLGTRPSPIANR